MQAICTKYIGPTDRWDARIKAYSESGLSVVVGYPHHKPQGAEFHRVAVEAFCAKHAGWGTAEDYHAGSIKGGWAWVWAKA